MQSGPSPPPVTYEELAAVLRELAAVPRTPPVPQPKPTGTPTRAWFTVGAIGHFFSVAASIAFGVFLLTAFFRASIWSLILGILLFVALLLHLFAFFGMRRNYGSLIGAATFGYGLAAVIFFLVASILALFAVDSYIYGGYYYNIWGTILIVVSWILIGVLFVLEGVAYILTRHFMGNPGSSLATGIIPIVGGSLISSVFLAIYGGFFVIVPGLIIGGILLLRAPLPPVQPPLPPVQPPPFPP